MCSFGRLVFILIILGFIKKLESINITVYYESLCSDSVDFITKQLYPNYNGLKEYLNIEFVPYGKSFHTYSRSHEKYVFSCHHGGTECKGNRAHSCAFNQTTDQDTKVEFINCIMKSSNPSNGAYIKRCAVQHQLDYDKIIECERSKQGESLLFENGERTWKLEPNIYMVPTVQLENSQEIVQSEQTQALTNFKGFICSKIPEPKPEGCRNMGFLRKMSLLFGNS